MIAITSPSPHLQAFAEGHTAWLILNRPERRNALNAAMWEAIPPLVAGLSASPEVRVIVIRGAGTEAFAAGADISEFGESRNDAAAAARYEQLNGEAFAAVRGCAKPVIAMIHGFCIGGGLALALAADLRIADRSALFALPPARLGLAYPLDGLRDLVATVGAAASVGSYAIALWAMTVAPMALVASLRETSVLFAVALGAWLLKEPWTRWRILGAVSIVAGVIVLRLG